VCFAVSMGPIAACLGAGCLREELGALLQKVLLLLHSTEIRPEEKTTEQLHSFYKIFYAFQVFSGEKVVK